MFKRLNRATYDEFFLFINNNDNIIWLLQALEIIPESRNCSDCCKEMLIKTSSNHLIGSAWKCSRCKRRVNLLVDSTLDGLKVSPKIFLKFAFYFFQKNTISQEISL
ncbi:hypothetical protein DMUE_3910 [Dictyocoela muelleri]|nr:hypothetical protein DMUE_3910 [Dictyocoela muelleri]